MTNSAIRSYGSGQSAHNFETYKAICAESGIPDGYNQDSHIWVIKAPKSTPTPQRSPSPTMDTPSRAEIDAKLEAVEARMDARVAGMSAKLDVALAEMKADREANAIRFAAMTQSINDVRAGQDQFKDQVRSVKSNVWGATVATISIVGLIVGFGLSAFDSGRETSKSVAEATERMKAIQMQLEAQSKAMQAPVSDLPKRR